MPISEIHFSNCSYLRFYNYTIYVIKQPDGAAHKVSAVINKNNLKHYKTFKFQKDYIQATSVVIEDSFGPTTLTSVDCPLRHIKQ